MYTFHDIDKRLHFYIVRQRFINLTAHLVFTVAVVLIAFSVSCLLFKSPMYGFLGFLVILLYRPIRTSALIAQLDARIGFQGELTNSLQLARIPLDNKERYSHELIMAHIHTIAQKLSHIDLCPFSDYTRLHIAVYLLIVAFICALLQPAFVPERFWYALTHDTRSIIQPGDAMYQRGTEISLDLILTGVYIPTHATLVIERDNEILKYRLDILNRTCTHALTLDKGFAYHYVFLDTHTPRYTIDVVEPIFIEDLSFHLQYPTHTHLRDETKHGRQLIVPEHTQVSLIGTASQDLNHGQLIYTDTVELTCEGRSFNGSFEINKSGTATLLLTSHRSFQDQITIYAIPDCAPLVDIFYPGYNIDIPSSMNVPIGIRCSDDYGLSSATFYYVLKDTCQRMLDLGTDATEDTLHFNWDLSDELMLPGDELAYYVQVTDNAGNTACSKTYYVYFPTMEEIYDEISEKENELQTDLAELVTDHNERMEELSRIEQKLMKEKSFKWADREQLEELITRESEMLENIEEWQNEVQRTLEKLNEGLILDPQSVERLLEIAKILDEIAPDEFRTALENLEQFIKKKPEDLEQGLEKFKEHQEEFAKMLERTLELLRRFQQEEQLRELAEKAKDLAQRAAELDSVQTQHEDAQLSEEMPELTQQLEELIKQIEELAASENLEQEMKTQLEQLARQSTEMLPSSSSQRKKQLDLLAAELAKLYEQLTQGRTAQLRQKLMDILNELIEISKAQEDLYENDAQFDAEQQNYIVDATETLAESLYAQQTKSLYVTPHMGKNLAKAVEHMKHAQRLEQHVPNAQEAMRLINLVCYEMLRNLEQATEGAGSSTGMQNFMQQLSNLSQGQMSINQSLGAMFPIPVQGMSGEQKAQLKKLAGQQRALRQQLEGLRNEPGAQKFQSLIDELVNQMQETEEDLFQYKLDRELIERQHVVLSRLLDAQRSIRKEDYQKQRQSVPGEDFATRHSPAPVPEELGEDKLRTIIQQALKEGYPKEYELYIRHYFQKLIEEK
jgi:hypothetical protein